MMSDNYAEWYVRRFLTGDAPPADEPAPSDSDEEEADS